MKRFLSLFLICCLALSFAACAEKTEDTAVFYYLRSEDTIAYGQIDALIAPLPHQPISSLSLNDLLQLYLNGPGDEYYRNPIPKGTYLLSTIRHEDTLVIVLSREFSTLDGIQLTLAGACLSATCRQLTGLDCIQVRSGENIYEFDYRDFTFLDDSGGT